MNTNCGEFIPSFARFSPLLGFLCTFYWTIRIKMLNKIRISLSWPLDPKYKKTSKFLKQNSPRSYPILLVLEKNKLHFDIRIVFTLFLSSYSTSANCEDVWFKFVLFFFQTFDVLFLDNCIVPVDICVVFFSSRRVFM